MTPADLVQALELERVQHRPGRHMAPVAYDDRPQTAAERLAAVVAASRLYDWEPARKNRARYHRRQRRLLAVERARQAAGR
ncbi:hypothetical protein [Microlunatus parietis]|uniref:Uncharacterized protein n=1 Tax=Microlunatus parietis TaxID=682979 RepID=A0A7Y9I2G3_9ACTN|nr:hypothetical protein [Microlunatus parietis]NYE68892.1 hypothetical protein [Microlunatus parietis]